MDILWFTHYEIFGVYGVKTEDYEVFNYFSQLSWFLTRKSPRVSKYLSVADNVRDAVLLHVSASSERQE